MKKNLRNLAILCLVSGSIVVFSCRNEGDKNDAPEPMQNEMHQEGDQAEMEEYKGEELQAEFKEKKTREIYAQYVAIKDAFVNTNGEDAREGAKELAEIANKNQEIASIAKSIAASDDVNRQREEFSRLTLAMEPLLKNALASGEIYKQYCPMAFEGKGDFWYSNSEEIFNPYYGDKMLKCGRVEGTIQ